VPGVHAQTPDVAVNTENVNFSADSAAPETASNPAGKKIDVTIIESQLEESQMLPGDDISRKLPKPVVVKPVRKLRPTRAVPKAVEPQSQTEVVPAAVVAQDPDNIQIQSRQVIQINKSLSRIIEENEKLRKEKEELDRSLRTLRGQRNLEETRVNTAVKERDQYKKELDEIVAKNAGFQKEMADLRGQLEVKGRWMESRIKNSTSDLSLVDQQKLLQIQKEIPDDQRTLELLRFDLRSAKERLDQLQEVLPLMDKAAAAETAATGSATNATPTTAVTADTTLQGDQQKGEEVLALLNEFSKKSEKLRADEARVHYNMGNKYFHEGDYQKAADEYGQAIKLQPEDASAHFNLAFVSGEFVKDFKSAVKHYRLYLMLNPSAPDENLVKEKIIEAELILKSTLDHSRAERDWQSKRNELYTR